MLCQTTIDGSGDSAGVETRLLVSNGDCYARSTDLRHKNITNDYH